MCLFWSVGGEANLVEILTACRFDSSTRRGQSTGREQDYNFETQIGVGMVIKGELPTV